MSSRRFISREALDAGLPCELVSFAAPARDAAPQIDPFEQGLEEGLAQGYAAGRQEALERAARQAQADAARLDAVCAALAAQRAPLAAVNARDAVELAVVMAQQIVRHTLQLPTDHITAVVAAAIAALPRTDAALEVYLHPDDAVRLQAQLETGGARLARHTLRLVPDARLSPGGCRIEAPCGDVDATLETRWAHLLAALQQTLTGAPAGGGPALVLAP